METSCIGQNLGHTWSLRLFGGCSGLRGCKNQSHFYFPCRRRYIGPLPSCFDLSFPDPTSFPGDWDYSDSSNVILISHFSPIEDFYNNKHLWNAHSTCGLFGHPHPATCAWPSPCLKRTYTSCTKRIVVSCCEPTTATCFQSNCMDSYKWARRKFKIWERFGYLSCIALRFVKIS